MTIGIGTKWVTMIVLPEVWTDGRVSMRGSVMLHSVGIRRRVKQELVR